MSNSEGWILFVIGILCGLLFGIAIGNRSRHDALCKERLIHALTTRDSIVIYIDDNYCMGTKR